MSLFRRALFQLDEVFSGDFAGLDVLAFLPTDLAFADDFGEGAFDAEFDWLSSYHSRCFYAKYTPNLVQLESGYLKSMLLIKVC